MTIWVVKIFFVHYYKISIVAPKMVASFYNDSSGYFVSSVFFSLEFCLFILKLLLLLIVFHDSVILEESGCMSGRASLMLDFSGHFFMTWCRFTILSRILHVSHMYLLSHITRHIVSGCPTSEGHLVKVVTSRYLSCKDFSFVELGYMKQMHISLWNQ